MLRNPVRSFCLVDARCWAILLSLLLATPASSRRLVQTGNETVTVDEGGFVEEHEEEPVLMMADPADFMQSEGIIAGESSFEIDSTGEKVLEYPFLVSLLGGGNTVICGGALIANKYVLTAASCVDIRAGGVTNPTVVARSVSGKPVTDQAKELSVASVNIHPDYYSKGTNLAVLKLSSSAKASTVKLPSSTSLNIGTRSLVLLGFGRLSQNSGHADTSQKLSVTGTDDVVCEIVLGLTVSSNEFCVESNGGSCQGDVGGPIIIERTPVSNSVIVGVVGTVEDCGNTGAEIHTQVAPSLDWIQETAGLS